MADRNAAFFRRLVKPMRVDPGARIRLPQGFDPGHTSSFVNQSAASTRLQQGVQMLSEYQDRLAAQDTFGLLVVLQALDAAGKDGAVKHVMSGVNPAGVQVHSFKVPSAEELSHEYLWRYARALPRRGEISIFNRSHYEEVLVVRVHPELLQRQRLPATPAPSRLWPRRFREINRWERYLTDNGIRIVKLFLNISREEQRRRFLQRIDRAEKNWKFSTSDVLERRHWDDYQHAYSAVLTHTSTAWAPWHVIPADHKWFARLSVAAVVLDALVAINPQYPRLSVAERRQLEGARAELEAEG
jgi:PPK2 family polyphosphate:nucleotide phosphotransferase